MVIMHKDKQTDARLCGRGKLMKLTQSLSVGFLPRWETDRRHNALYAELNTA